MLEYYFLTVLLLAALSFIYYLINSYLSLNYKDDHTNGNKSSAKDVTIVVPVYKENVSTFNKCINAIAKQGCKFIVVGDSSNEPYRSIVEKNKGIFIWNEKRGGQRKAIATGMRLVDTAYVMIMDSDTVIPAHAVKSMLSKFGRDVGGVGTSISITPNGKWVSYSAEFFQRAKEIVSKAMAHSGTVFVISGRCGMFRTGLVKPFLISKEFSGSKIFGRKNIIAEDQHLTSHVIKSGYRAVIDYETKVFTDSQENFRLFFYQLVRWAKGGYLFFFKELSDGSYAKKGALYSFETFYIYLLPIAILAMGLVRLDLIYTYNIHNATINSGIMGLLGIFFINISNPAIIAYQQIAFVLGVSGTIIFLLVLSRTLNRKKLKTIALGGITSLLMFCAAIYALATIWDQESWGTK